MKLDAWQKEILQKWQKGTNKESLILVRDQLLQKFPDDVLCNEPMAPHTYVKIGGPADIFFTPRSFEAVKFALTLAEEHRLPCYFHGSGANTLIKDGGIRGLVISIYNVLNQHEVIAQTDQFIDIRAEAGTSFSKLVHLSRDMGALDLAPLSGIPGSLGGLIRMNAGTREREIKDVVRQITVLTKELEIKTISREKLAFEYRHLKLPRGTFILEAILRLEKLCSPEDADAAIKRYQKRRADTQPLDYPNLGSMFKNPQPQHKKDVLVSAGQLIEEAGLKNIRVGGARISPKHANFIVNENRALAKDVLALMNMIKDRVKMVSGVVLEPEIKIVGENEKDS